MHLGDLLGHRSREIVEHDGHEITIPAPLHPVINPITVSSKNVFVGLV